MKRIELKFLGKDSVPYKKVISLPDDVYDELRRVYLENPDTDLLFPHANSATVSEFLNRVHAGISPKQLRTAKCNEVLVKNLLKSTVTAESSELEKIRAIYEANLEIAKTLNHQKNVAKNAQAGIDKAKDKVKDVKKKLEMLKGDIKEKLEILKDKKETIKVRYAKMPAAKREALAKVKDAEEKLSLRLERVEAQLEKAKYNYKKRNDTKDVALGTSLANYADPRIIYSFCKDKGLDIGKIYNAAMQKKFEWAANTDENFWKNFL